MDYYGECTMEKTVQIIANPFNGQGFVAQIITGRHAFRSYIADGRSTVGRWSTYEDAKASAIRYGYAVQETATDGHKDNAR